MALHPYNTGLHNHAITAKTYINETARDADLAWQKTSNLNKVVQLADTSELWMLVSVGPSVWTQLNLGSVEAAPSAANDTGFAGELRFAATGVYLCTATDTWVRAVMATW